MNVSLSVHPAVFALAAVGVLYLYVELGKARWGEMVRRETKRETNELVLELSMTDLGFCRRWQSLLLYGVFVGTWPALLAIGWCLSKVTPVRP